jgi:AraC-like DNA-binding protein
MNSGPATRGDDSDPYFASSESLDAFRTLSVRGLDNGTLTAAHFRRDKPDLGITVPNETSDVLMAVVNLRPLGGNNVWCDGRHTRRAAMPQGSVFVLDHRQSWESEVTEAFETVHMFLPVKSLITYSGQIGDRQIDTLNCPITSVQNDPVIYHLALALLPAIQNPEQANRLFTDHVFGAIQLHLATKYGELILSDDFSRGGLTPTQRRLVTEILLDDLTGDFSIADLASHCDLSPRHFARAFKATHGTPPHRWLLRQRTEHAKVLLEGTPNGIGEIALMCGFADQSHLTRVFRGLVGTTPAAWRKARQG